MTIDEINEKIAKAAIIISATDKNIRQTRVHDARKKYFEDLLEEFCEYWREKAGTPYVPPKDVNILTYML